MKSETKKSPKKELEKSITDKFIVAVSELGHDAQKLKREIKKAAKFISKKIDRKIKAAKSAVEKTLDDKPEKKAASKTPKAEKTVTAVKAKVGTKLPAAKKTPAKPTDVVTDVAVPSAATDKPVKKPAAAKTKSAKVAEVVTDTVATPS